MRPNLSEILKKNSGTFHPIVPFYPAEEKLIAFDFSEKNAALQHVDLSDTAIFCKYINHLLQSAHAKFGIGGYGELRTLYSRSGLFDNKDQNAPGQEPRRFHLGMDIWGKEGTVIAAPMNGAIHSFFFNDNFGDYGATIILKHCLQDFLFYTLYGHLSLANLAGLQAGKEIERGQIFAHFGKPAENGHWPPHLHFQIIDKIGNYKGDYPGVCKFSEKTRYLLNSPDPDLVVNMNKFIC